MNSARAVQNDGIFKRLYRLKVTFAAIVGSIAGVVVLVAGHHIETWQGKDTAWIRGLPWESVGTTLLSTCIIVLVFEYLAVEDAENRSVARLRSLFPEQAELTRKAVLEGLAFDPDSLTAVVSDEVLDRAIQNAFAVRLGSSAAAEQLYTDVRAQVFAAPERWSDVRVRIELSPASPADNPTKEEMFVVSVRWEYVTELQRALEFACVDDELRYSKLLADPTLQFAWFVERLPGLTAVDEQAFSIEQVSIDGLPVQVSRASANGVARFSAVPADIDTLIGRECTIAYTYRYLQQKKAHCLYLDVAQPSESVEIQFIYTGCGIKWVNQYHFFPGLSGTRVERSPATVPSRSLTVAHDGWVFPKAGVVFVWVLDSEFRGRSVRGKTP